LDEGLTTPHLKKPACYDMLHKASDFDIFFVITLAKENGHFDVRDQLVIRYSAFVRY
jgi:hypothetical protein